MITKSNSDVYPGPYSTAPGGLRTTARRSSTSQLLLDIGSKGVSVLPRALMVIWVAAASISLAAGWPYYTLAMSARPYSDLHATFSPAGTIGLLYGLVGTACMMIGVSMYIARKRVPLLKKFGPLNSWLQVHIFLCTIGPFFILLHTSFKFGGVVAIAFWSMTFVAASGIFGKYVFSHLPKTIQGNLRTLDSVKSQKGTLMKAIARDAGIRTSELRKELGIAPPREPRGVAHAFFLAVSYDLTSRVRRRRIRRFLRQQNVPDKVRKWIGKLLSEQITLEQQVVLLRPFQRVFHLWHLMHLPLSLLMLVIVILHIGVAVAMGYAWPVS